MMRDEAVYMLWRSVKERLGISHSVLESALKDWEVVPLLVDGEVVGAFVIKNAEVHLGYGDLPKGSIRHHIKTVFEPTLKRFGHLKTSVLEQNTKGIEFCKRMGFEEVGRSNGLVHMQCERLNYV